MDYSQIIIEHMMSESKALKVLANVLMPNSQDAGRAAEMKAIKAMLNKKQVAAKKAYLAAKQLADKKRKSDMFVANLTNW